MKETMAKYLEYRKNAFKNGISDFQQIAEDKSFDYDYALTIVKLTSADLRHLMADGILIIGLEQGEFTVAVIGEGSVHDKSVYGKPIHDKSGD